MITDSYSIMDYDVSKRYRLGSQLKVAFKLKIEPHSKDTNFYK